MSNSEKSLILACCITYEPPLACAESLKRDKIETICL